ncbi:MAG TPA: hypothetical protein VGH91_04615 [Gammaproteobacteria bacterium]
MTASQFTCSQQIKSALEMQPTGMYRGDLYAKCSYPGKHDAHFGGVLNALVQAGDIIDHMEQGGKHRYFSPKAYVPQEPIAEAPTEHVKPVRIVLAEERRRMLVTKIREYGHPVASTHVLAFGLHTQKPTIYPDLLELVKEEVLERRDLADGNYASRAFWWFQGETWPELAVAPQPEPETPAPEAKANRLGAAAAFTLSDPVDDTAPPDLLTALNEAKDAAHEALNAYINSVCDKRVIASLKQNITFAEKALATHRAGRKA